MVNELRLRSLTTVGSSRSPSLSRSAARLCKRSSRNCTATTRADSRSTAEAMRTCTDSPAGELCRIELLYGLRQFTIDPELEHLVEVAIVQSAHPINAHESATHQALNGIWIEGLKQFTHITFLVS